MKMSSQKNWLQKINGRIAMWPMGAQLAARTMHHLDRLVLRLSNGRATAATLLTGLSILSLTTTGAKSGQPRTVPLVAIPHSHDQLVVIASNWGQARHPAWYYNILAHPQVIVTQNGRSQHGKPKGKNEKPAGSLPCKPMPGTRLTNGAPPGRFL